MKTVFINCSPKKRFCASAYFLFLQRMFTGGEKITEKLRTPADHDRILEQLRDAHAVVFCLPLYVDGVPSHVLRFLEKMEDYCKENHLSLHVYCIANNGFIEGRQNEPLMQVFENFCARVGLSWGGGVCIGRPLMVAIQKDPDNGAAAYLRNATDQLKKAMAFTGCADLSKFDPSIIRQLS